MQILYSLSTKLGNTSKSLFLFVVTEPDIGQSRYKKVKTCPIEQMKNYNVFHFTDWC